MAIINLTPHPCIVFDKEGKNVVVSIQSTGVARVKTAATLVESVSAEGVEIQVVETTYGEVEGLPASQEGTFCICLILVVTALRTQGISRPDVIAPDTGPDSVVRDADGKILGVRRFTR